MIERSLRAGLSFEWVVADHVYGMGEIERKLQHAVKGYTSKAWQEVTGSIPRGWEKDLSPEKPVTWLAMLQKKRAVVSAHELNGKDYTAGDSRTWIRGLLVRRNPTDGDLAYFTV